MAKSSNLPAQKYKAGERTATKIRLMADWDDGSPDRGHFAYVDLAQCLSAMNQRAYRQGLYYYVAGITVYNSNEDAKRVVFSTAPDTYTTKNAWARGFKAWMKMQRQVMQETGVIQAKYADYKVCLDDDHVALLTGTSIDRGSDDSDSNVQADNIVLQPSNNLMPLAYDKLNADTGDPSGSEVITTDEWAHSVYVAPDHGSADGNTVDHPDSFTAHIVGSHDGDGTPWTSVGLIQSYVNTRPFQDLTTDPQLEAGLDLEIDPIVAVFDTGGGNEEVLKDIDDFNDQTPYESGRPFGYDDDQLYQVAQVVVDNDGPGQIVRTTGFCVPFGLLRIDCQADTGVEIVIDMVPGPYHGVYAERVI